MIYQFVETGSRDNDQYDYTFLIDQSTFILLRVGTSNELIGYNNIMGLTLA